VLAFDVNMPILGDAQEKLERRYSVRQSGIDLDTVEQRVIDLFSVRPDDLYGPGRQRRIVRARSIFCFWAVRELGLSQKALADRFSVTEPAITYAVRRGQNIARENGYRLREE
jgi:putative transposase